MVQPRGPWRRASQQSGPEPAPGPSPRFRAGSARCALGLFFVLGAVALLGTGGAGADEGAATPEGVPPVAVAATTQSLGALEPCDCVEGMLGGFPRRLALLRKLRGAGRAPVFAFDGGDLTGKARHPGLLAAKTRAALDLCRAGDIALVAAGERDLRLGVDRLRELSAAAGVPVACDNLVRPGPRGEERPLAGPGRLVRGGRSLLVVALLDPALGAGDPGLRLEAPQEALRRVVAAQGGRRPGEALVVLFHGDGAAAERLFGTADPAPDLVLAGHDQQRRLPPRRAGRTWVVELLRDARALSEVVLAPGGVRARHLSLDEHVPDDPRARARVERYFAEVAGLPEPPRRPTAGGGFVGSAACAACHREAWERFRASKHHRAQHRVAAAKPARARARECIGCHVVGYGFDGGFVDLEATPELGEVGCESCHGVGGAHVARGGGRGYGLRPGFPESWRPLCTSCHDPSNSPGFDFERRLEAIRHWKPRGQ